MTLTSQNKPPVIPKTLLAGHAANDGSYSTTASDAEFSSSLCRFLLLTDALCGHLQRSEYALAAQCHVARMAHWLGLINKTHSTSQIHELAVALRVMTAIDSAALHLFAAKPLAVKK